MGLFGNLFSSSSSAPTTTTTTDGRIGASAGAVVATDNANINFLSDTALQQALTFAGKDAQGSRNLLEKVYSKAFETFVSTQNKSFDSSLSAQASAFKATRSDSSTGFRQMLIAGVSATAVLAAGTAAVFIFKGK